MTPIKAPLATNGKGGHIRAATKADIWKDTNVSAEGVYKIDPDWFAALPAWTWDDLFVYGRHDAEGYKINDGKGSRPLGVKPSFREQVLKA